MNRLTLCTCLLTKKRVIQGHFRAVSLPYVKVAVFCFEHVQCAVPVRSPFWAHAESEPECLYPPRWDPFSTCNRNSMSFHAGMSGFCQKSSGLCEHQDVHYGSTRCCLGSVRRRMARTANLARMRCFQQTGGLHQLTACWPTS